jgi:sugar lactone lactonase YvrE
MKECTAKPINERKYCLGEGSLWHPEWCKFLFVDILGGLIGVYDPYDESIREILIGKKVGCVVPAFEDKNVLIVALQGELAKLDIQSGQIFQIMELETNKPNNRCNEGKMDSAGRLWFGTMHMDGIANAGNLYCFHNGKLEIKIPNTSISNGICWSHDKKTMYYIDSPLKNVRAFDYDFKTADISNERVVIHIDEGEEGEPDGMCIDRYGMLWVAIWGRGCVNRYDPFTGKIIGKVRVPAAQVSSCALGGENEDILFITTAYVGLEEKNNPFDGKLFVVNNIDF